MLYKIVVNYSLVLSTTVMATAAAATAVAQFLVLNTLRGIKLVK